MKFSNNFTVTIGLLLVLASCATNRENIEQYGSMHEAIGQKKSQGRVKLNTLVSKDNYLGIGALENLDGEITIFGGEAIITKVNKTGRPESLTGKALDASATMLVGGQVKEWVQIKTPISLNNHEFQEWVAKEAKKLGFKNNTPFMFKVKGELSNVRMHIINGACPLHARMHKIKLSKDERPYEGNYSSIKGKIVGVFAKNSVGKLTHPDTNIHPHIIYKNKKGIQLTGHLENFGIKLGSILYLPKL